MSDALFRPGGIMTVEAIVDNLFDRGIIPSSVDESLSPFGSRTAGPEICLNF